MPLPIPQIRPISDLRTNLNDVCELAHESQQPIFMTKNGKASVPLVRKSFVGEGAAKPGRFASYVQKLREAEIEEKYRSESLTKQTVGDSIERLFAHWGV